MKLQFTYLLLVLFTLSIVSCSTSSSSDSGNNGVTPTVFFPLKAGNYWTYNVVSPNTTPTRDSVYVANDTTISSIPYKKIKTRTTPTGFFSTSVRNNGLRIEGSTVKLSGKVDFDLGLPSPLSFSVSDFILVKENALANESLSSSSGSFVQTINSYPLTFEYKLTSVADESLNAYLSNGTTYNNVQKTKVVLNLKITTSTSIGGITVPITVMNAQDVLTSMQYYAKNIGLVYNNTLINYTLNSLPGVTLPIPSSGSQTQEEFLHTFLINP